MVLPIATHELRRGARRQRPQWRRVGVGLLGSLTALAMFFPSIAGLRTPSETGRQLFVSLSLLAFSFALGCGVFTTADALSREKREGTLGLLLLTSLRPLDVVMGKLTATALHSWFALLALAPILGLPLLHGGVTGGELIRVILVLCGTMLCSLSIGLLVSALSCRGHRAMISTLALLALLAVPPALMLRNAGGGLTARPPAWAAPGPTLGFYLAFDRTYAREPLAFWCSLLFTHGLACLSIVLASVRVGRSYADAPTPTRRLPNRGVTRRWGWRCRQRGGWDDYWLDTNPLAWWMQRSHASSSWLVTALLGVLLALAVSWLRDRPIQVHPALALALPFLAQTTVEVWIARATTHRLWEAKTSGELELLLTTPLGVRRILQAHLFGIVRQFLGPVVWVAAFSLVLPALSAVGAGGWINRMELGMVGLMAVGLFLVNTLALFWVGVWQSSRVQVAGRALAVTLAIVWGPQLVLFALLGPTLTQVWGSGSPVTPAVLGCLAVGYFNALGFAGWAGHRCSGRLRQAVSAGLQSS
jgi:hypothetical protein